MSLSAQPTGQSTNGGPDANNPFRVSSSLEPTASSAVRGATSPFDDPPSASVPQTVSRNPFLDPSGRPIQSTTMPAMLQPDPGATIRTSNVRDFFESLSIDPKTASASPKPQAPISRAPISLMADADAAKPSAIPKVSVENIPTPGSSLSANRRPVRPQDEDAHRTRRMHQNTRSRSGRPLPPPTSPQQGGPTVRCDRGARRNSDSSILTDFATEPITEEELKMIETKRREDKRREDARKQVSYRLDRRLDIIDQLDATSIFGTVHHDGPFDALNPHRNRKGSRRAPIQAFPQDSLNNVMGGSGPVNSRPDHATFMGNQDAEAFKDFAPSSNKPGYVFQDQPRDETPVFDPLRRGFIVHGNETIGLGTSTFLEGTPAARTVIERTEAEKAMEEEVMTLQRKKSLAQRIRHINKGGYHGPSGRFNNPDDVPLPRSPDLHGPSTSPLLDSNPFFSGLSKNKELDVTESVASSSLESPIAFANTLGRTQSKQMQQQPPNRRSGILESRTTIETISPTISGVNESLPRSPGPGPGPGTGLLARVKSLKNGGRRRGSDAQPSIEILPQALPTSLPGSAL